MIKAAFTFGTVPFIASLLLLEVLNLPTLSQRLLSMYNSTVQPGPSGSSLPMQRSRPTLAYKHPIFIPLT